VEFNIIDIIGVIYAFSATRPENTPPRPATRRGRACVEKRTHMCYISAKAAATATQPRRLTLPTLRRHAAAPLPLLPELLASSKILKILKARQYGGKAVKKQNIAAY